MALGKCESCMYDKEVQAYYIQPEDSLLSYTRILCEDCADTCEYCMQSFSKDECTCDDNEED